MLFRNKTKKETTDNTQINTDTNYRDWDKDLGFLILQINRQIQYGTKYEIPSIMSVMKDNKSEFIKDNDLNETYASLTNEILTELSDQYKTYLCTKYFKDEQALAKFIYESIYTALVDASIEANNEKIQAQNKQILTEKINQINKQINKTI